jgi:hypothetical protein
LCGRERVLRTPDFLWMLHADLFRHNASYFHDNYGLFSLRASYSHDACCPISTEVEIM